MTLLLLIRIVAAPASRFGWIGEPFVWVYLGTLWAGGLRIWLGTLGSVAEVSPAGLVVRPLHLLRAKHILWEAITGAEQMIGGDRMILYFNGSRGPRHVALNLNLVKGRRPFVERVELHLRQRGFHERIEGRSRYLSAKPPMSVNVQTGGERRIDAE